MKNIISISIFILVLLFCLNTVSFADLQFNVINTYDVPYVTNGIEYVDGYLYYNDLWDAIRKFDPALDAVVGSIPSPSPTQGGHDLAWDGTYFWLDDMFGNMIYQFDMSGTVISSIPLPPEGSMGLTYDGTNLWSASTYQEDNPVGDGKIRKLDPSDGNVLGIIPGPATNIMGLEWDGSSLWTLSSDTGAADPVTTIWQINPSDGSVISSSTPFPTWVDRAHDLVWGGGYLWVTVDDFDGSTTNLQAKIYQLSVVPEPISSILFVTGGAVFAGRRYWKKKRQT